MFTLSVYGLLSLGLWMFAIWLLSVWKKDASLVDRFWGLSFILLCTVYRVASGVHSSRSIVVFGLILIWGLRLSLHIHFRNRKMGEDYRYRAMREEQGKSFVLWSLFSVFLLQGLIAWVVAAPLLWIFSQADAEWRVCDLLALLLWVLGFSWEFVADLQLQRFKADPSKKGMLLNSGLWQCSRHPNYFGEAVMSWAYFGFALSVPGGYLSFYGPLVMTLLLRYVTGVSLLEKNMKKTKPGFQEYLASTPALFPDMKRIWQVIKASVL